MKKIALLILFVVVINPIMAMANVIENEVVAPKWEDYIPTKYQEPRTDFTKGKSIAELVVGITLTDLLITAPIGIPMVCHSSTKLKHISYCKKKEMFLKGLAEAENITDSAEKKAYYDKLLKDCKMTEKMKVKQAKRVAKGK